MKIKQLLKDYNIPFRTHGANVSTGWIGICCPFCNDNNYHLGFNLDQEEWWSCWKCGSHSNISTIGTLLSISRNHAKQVIDQYKGKDSDISKRKPYEKQMFHYPSNTGELQANHRLYLERRNFDPDYLISMWDIKATGATSLLGKYDYKLRILVPIYWGGRIVSFQSRDITDRAEQRYKACPKEYEVIHHKDILFVNGKNLKRSNVGLCVEGVFDCFRLGLNSFATFGISYTPLQLREISRLYEKIFVIYDSEEKAQEKAEKLVAELQFRGKKAENILLQKEQDPASLSAEEVRYLTQQFVK